eukprot:TRINITY_DN16869_c0_g1_i2.p1 TRINITY_DN16869_c0_g1~~TRINITY_DN16869_c0_g1_i2.p1  ORF type:complete len:207 (-),score=31.36 TRINITY_DN16869_c0_g1_i2:208-828(-)
MLIHTFTEVVEQLEQEMKVQLIYQQVQKIIISTLSYANSLINRKDQKVLLYHKQKKIKLKLLQTRHKSWRLVNIRQTKKCLNKFGLRKLQKNTDIEIDKDIKEEMEAQEEDLQKRRKVEMTHKNQYQSLLGKINSGEISRRRNGIFINPSDISSFAVRIQQMKDKIKYEKEIQSLRKSQQSTVNKQNFQNVNKKQQKIQQKKVQKQ